MQKPVHAQTRLILTRLLEAGIVRIIIPTTVVVIISALLAWARSRLGRTGSLTQRVSSASPKPSATGVTFFFLSVENRHCFGSPQLLV